MTQAWTRALVERWKRDPGSTSSTWFLWEERLKNLRSARTRGPRAACFSWRRIRASRMFASSSRVPYGALERERAAIARLGSGLKPLHAISRSLGGEAAGAQ